MDATSVAIAVGGLVATAGIAVVTVRDATRIGVPRPRTWAAITAGTFAVGVGLLLFASVPLTGVVLTANTGAVLYTFEREIATEDDEPASPGALPGASNRRDRTEEE